MKKFTLIFTALIGLALLASCNDDSEESQESGQDVTNTFQRIGNIYETPNAYLVYSPVLQYDIETQMDVIKYRDHVTVIFTDGAITRDADGRIVYSTGTQQVFSASFRDITDGLVKDVIEDIDFRTGDLRISAGSTVVVDGNVDINYSEDNISYGELNGYYLPLTNEDIAEMSISFLEIDHLGGSGSIAATYSISPGIDGEVKGNYTGSFNILD
jgi:hypothetical protein